METRNVNLVGSNTLTVSLPKEFIKSNNIKKGDKLHFKLEEAKISFFASIKTKDFVLNIEDMTLHEVSRSLTQLYRFGYSQVKILFREETLFDPKENKHIKTSENIIKLINRHFTGAEVIDEKNKQIKIKFFSEVRNENIEIVEERIFKMIKEAIEKMFLNLNKEFEKYYETVYEKHDTITRLINYFIRLNYFFEKSNGRILSLYSMYVKLDSLLDRFRKMNDYILSFGCSKKAEKYLETIFESFLNLYSQTLSGNISDKVISQKYEINQKILDSDLEKEEVLIVQEAKEFLDARIIFLEYYFSRKNFLG